MSTSLDFSCFPLVAKGGTFVHRLGLGTRKQPQMWLSSHLRTHFHISPCPRPMIRRFSSNISKIERKNAGGRKLYIKGRERKPAGDCRADGKGVLRVLSAGRNMKLNQGGVTDTGALLSSGIFCAGRNTWEASQCLG